MPISNPSGGNPQSGHSVGLPDTETAVVFAWSFGRVPHVVISGWSEKEVWLTEVTAVGFKWLNSSDKEIAIDWIADEV